MANTFRFLSVFLEAEILAENPVCFLSSNINLAIELPTKKEVLDKLYTKLASISSENRSKFYFVIKGIKNPLDHADDLGRFFFLKNYKFRRFGSPFLIIEDGELNILYKELSFWCTSQGFGKLDILDYTTDLPEVLHKDLIYLVENRYEEFFHRLIAKESDVLRWALQLTMVRIDDSEAFVSFNKDLTSIEKKVAMCSPTLPNALAYLSEIEEVNLALFTSLSYHQDEAKFLKMYNEMLRSGDESQTILKFYNEQYEVLPLWYKRFGHVIKIMMGKRKVKFPF